MAIDQTNTNPIGSFASNPSLSGAGNVVSSVLSNPIGTISGYLGQQAAVQGYGVSPQDQELRAKIQQQQFMENYQRQQQLQTQALAGQGNLAGSLWNTVNNVNAPSVAQQQLGQGVSAANAAATGLAATGTGANNALLTRQALQQSGVQQAQANQASGLIRANEVANAQQGLGAIYGAQLGSAGQMASTDAGGNVGIANTGASLANTTQNVNSAAQLANAKQNSSFLGTIGGGLSSLAGLL